MSHSLTRIWIHGVFGTRNRQPLLTADVRKVLFPHIKEEMEAQGCSVRIVNGTRDHVHILFLLPRELSVAGIMKSVKGESAHWINQRDLISLKFAWQIGYGGFSVSESNVPAVEEYIIDQKKHHRKLSFAEEYALLLQRHGLEINH